MTVTRSAALTVLVLVATTLPVTPARADGPPAQPGQQACLDAYDSGQRERQVGHPRAARDRFRVCADPACPSVVRTDCATWLEQASAEVPTIVVSVRDSSGEDVQAARVFLDGEPLATALDGRPAEVDPGAHTLRCELDGHPPIERAIVVQGGEKDRAIAVTIDDSAAPAPLARPSAHQVLPYALGGAGAAALLAFAYLGLSGRSDIATMRETCAPRCAEDRVDAANGKLVAADVSLVIALGSLGAATWFYLHPLGGTGATGAVGVRPTASGASLQMGVSF